jgi:hypothetical protein
MKYLFLLYGKPLPEPGTPEAASAYRAAQALEAAAPEREFLTGRLRSPVNGAGPRRMAGWPGWAISRLPLL